MPREIEDGEPGTGDLLVEAFGRTPSIEPRRP
jgi:hypothetical protein